MKWINLPLRQFIPMTLLGFGLAAATVLFLVERRLGFIEAESEVRQSAGQVVALVGAQMESAYRLNLSPHPDNLLSQLNSVDHFRAAAVIARGGEILHGLPLVIERTPLAETPFAMLAPRLSGLELFQGGLAHPEGPDSILLAAIPLRIPEDSTALLSSRPAVLVAAFDLTRPRAMAAGEALWHAGILTFTFGAASVLWWLLFYRFHQKRFERLVQYTREVVESGHRPSPLNGRDELAGLGRAIEQMTRTIESRTRELERSLILSAKLVEHSPIPIGISRLDDGTLLEVNPAYCRQLGYSREELLGRSVIDMGVWASIEERERIMGMLARGDRVANVEVRFRVRSGEVRASLLSMELLTFDGERLLLGMVVDIQDRKVAESERQTLTDELRRLAVHLQAVREEERTAIAREIHDEFGQILTVLKMHLTMIEREFDRFASAGAREAAARDFSRMNDLIDQSSSRLSRLISELRPAILDDLGLVPAMEWLVQEFERSHGIPVRFDCTLDEDHDLDHIRRLALYRILQEALTNVARHAEAGRVEVHFGQIDDHYRLQIEDDGVGMAAGNAGERPRFGLLGMRERALVLGGTLTVDSKPGDGTSVAVTLPAGPPPGNGPVK